MTGFRAALAALDEAGIPVQLRKIDDPTQELPPEGELDIWLDRQHFDAADEALRAAGFRHMETPGDSEHRFYLAFQGGRWLKLDAKIPATAASSRPRRLRLGPASATRRLGPVVAVLGPDGAGKGSLVSSLKSSIPVAVTPFYLGIRKRGARGKRMGEAAMPARAGREVAGLLKGAVRTWWIFVRVYAAAWRGHIVLCDRHPIEVLAIRPRRTRAGEMTERVVTRLIPKPDAIVILDAPGEVLYRRKHEHSVEVLEQWRRRYAEVFGPMGAVTISTRGPRRVAVDRASEVVWNALAERRGW